MDELLRDFLTETSELIEGIEAQLVVFEQNPSDPAPIASIFRFVHTIKGTASFLDLNRLQKVAHSTETLLGLLRDGVPPTERAVSLILTAMDRIKDIMDEVEAQGSEAPGGDADITDAIDALCENGLTGADGSEPPPASSSSTPKTAEAPRAETAESAGPKPGAKADASRVQGSATSSPESIRVSVGTIEQIMELVSELVLTRNQLLELTRSREGDAVKTPLQRLSALTTDLQDAVMRARMQPVGRLFASLPRLVRELSVELGKKIDLVAEGADTELDRQLIEVIRDPLTHLIRNCADHGIETPETRKAAGKPEAGTVRVRAFHEAGQVTLEVSDDGKGLDVEKIRAKAIRLGFLTEEQAAVVGESELYRFILEPGFSTAQTVTAVSGRGVGMDVVRSNIEAVGGSVSLTSEAGRGTKFTLRIPLTLAIAPALIVQAGGQRFALPQNAVLEAVALGADSRHSVEKVQSALVLRLRDEVIPVIDLSAMLNLETRASGEWTGGLVVVVRVGANSFGVVVDAVCDVQEIVVKPLSASLSHLGRFSGHTILGDGSVVLILDPSGLAQALNVEKAAETPLSAQEAEQLGNAALLLKFRAGPGATKVIPLEFVSRILNVESAKIENADGRLVMMHQDRLMPVLAVGGAANLNRATCPVLVISVADTRFGLLVDQVLDILQYGMDLELSGESAETLGALSLKNRAVEVIDVMHFLALAFPDLHRERQAGRVLLVGKDIMTRTMIAPALMAAGYDVNLVTSPSHAQGFLENGDAPDAAVIDAAMPSDDAEALAAALQGLRETLPLVRLVGDHDGAASALSLFATAVSAEKLDRRSILHALAQVMRKTASGEARRARIERAVA